MATRVVVDKTQVAKAVAALMAFEERRAEEKQEESGTKMLFDDEKFISLQVQLKKTPENSRTKPIRISLPHTIYGRDGQEVCLFTKDPQRTFKDWLEEFPVKNVTKIIGISKLRKKYKQFKDRRDLLASYNLFLADSRIIPMLPPLLGVKFFDKKKQPCAVNLSKSHIFQSELQRAIDSTFLFISGPCCNIKIGTTSFSEQELVQNIVASIPLIVDRLPRKWTNVQAIHVKSVDSVALPIYTALPTLPEDDPNHKKRKAENKLQAGKKAKTDGADSVSGKKNKKTKTKNKPSKRHKLNRDLIDPTTGVVTAPPPVSTKDAVSKLASLPLVGRKVPVKVGDKEVALPAVHLALDFQKTKRRNRKRKKKGRE